MAWPFIKVYFEQMPHQAGGYGVDCISSSVWRERISDSKLIRYLIYVSSASWWDRLRTVAAEPSAWCCTTLFILFPSPFPLLFFFLTLSVELIPKQRSGLRSCVTFFVAFIWRSCRGLQISSRLLPGIHVSFWIRQSQTRERKCAISARRPRLDDVALHIILVKSDSYILVVFALVQ